MMYIQGINFKDYFNKVEDTKKFMSYGGREKAGEQSGSMIDQNKRAIKSQEPYRSARFSPKART